MLGLKYTILFFQDVLPELSPGKKGRLEKTKEWLRSDVGFVGFLDSYVDSALVGEKESLQSKSDITRGKRSTPGITGEEYLLLKAAFTSP